MQASAAACNDFMQIYCLPYSQLARQPVVLQVFTKCGVIKEGDDRKPRIKMYRDKVLGVAKGDGLVTYLKEPSVGKY